MQPILEKLFRIFYYLWIWTYIYILGTSTQSTGTSGTIKFDYRYPYITQLQTSDLSIINTKKIVLDTTNTSNDYINFITSGFDISTDETILYGCGWSGLNMQDNTSSTDTPLFPIAIIFS